MIVYVYPCLTSLPSIPQVLDFIRKDPRWKEIPEIKACVDEYSACKNLYDSLVSTRKMPSFRDQKERVNWLREKVNGIATARD